MFFDSVVEAAFRFTDISTPGTGEFVHYRALVFRRCFIEERVAVSSFPINDELAF